MSHVETIYKAGRDITPIDLGPIKSLIALILERCKPVSIWLFGSRAKGLAREDSDWDLLIVLPDETSEEEMFEELPPRQLRRLTMVNADVVYCSNTEFSEATSVPNMLAYEVARSGIVIA